MQLSNTQQQRRKGVVSATRQQGKGSRTPVERGRNCQQQRLYLKHLPRQQVEESRSLYTPHKQLKEGRTTGNLHTTDWKKAAPM